MALTPLEQRVVEHVAARESELVDLLRTLVGFDTVTHEPGTPPRQEAALQEHLARRLRAAGATVELSEPDPTHFRGHPMMPDGFTFAGRPQLVARFPGSDGGRTLLLNGHIDVVDVEPGRRGRPTRSTRSCGTASSRAAAPVT
jgi:acetylornithine deacetylase